MLKPTLDTRYPKISGAERDEIREEAQRALREVGREMDEPIDEDELEERTDQILELLSEDIGASSKAERNITASDFRQKVNTVAPFDLIALREGF